MINIIDELSSYYDINELEGRQKDEFLKSILKTRKEEPLACVFMSGLFKFSVFMSERVKKSPYENDFLTHELGHIYFNHNQSSIRYFNKIKKVFSNITIDQLKMSMDDDKARRLFNSYLTSNEFIMYYLNYVGDLQINSTLLEYDTIEGIDKYFEIDSVHPKKHGWQEGESFDYYIYITLSNLDKFLSDINDEDLNQLSGYLEVSSIQIDIDNIDSESFNDPDEVDPKSKDLNNKIDQLVDSLTSDESEELDKFIQDSLNSVESIDVEFKIKASNPDNRISLDDKDSFSDELALRINNLITKGSVRVNMVVHRNIFMNKLKNKYGGKLYVPSNRLELQYSNIEEIVFLVDVSSSVPVDTVKKCMNSILKFMEGNMTSKVTLIQWDDNLKDIKTDIDPRKGDEFIIVKGSWTNIAKGMKYVRTIKSDDEDYILVVISDFDDDMNEWNEELNEINKPKILINHSNNFRETQITDKSCEIIRIK